MEPGLSNVLPQGGRVATYAIAAGVGGFVLNYAVFRLTGFPFLYCWGSPLLAPVYGEWGQLAFTVLTLAGLVFLFMGRHGTAIKAALLMLFVAVIPQWANTLFLLGGSCNG